MRHIKDSKKLFTGFVIGILVGTLSLVGFQKVFAASVYNVTETSGTVGQSTTFEAQYTVDTAVQTWANNDILTLQLPANMTAIAPTFAIEYDTDTTNNGVGETAIGVGLGQGQFSYSSPTVSVKWSLIQWGAPVNGASTVRFLITANPTFENSSSTFTFGGLTANVGDTNPSGSDTVNIVAADANTSLTLNANSTVGVTGVAQLNFTIAARMTLNDTVVFTAPSNLSVSGILATGKSFGGAGIFTCSAAGQVITCTTDGLVNAGSGSIALSGIIAKWAAVGQTLTSFAINDNDQAGADISNDASGSVTDTAVGALSQSAISLIPTVVNQVAATTISFGTSASVPQGGKVVVTLPAGWDITQANGQTASGLSGLDGVWTATVSGQDLILTQTGGSITTAGIKTFTISGVRSPVTPGFVGANFGFTTKNSGGQNIESSQVSPEVFIAPGIGEVPVVLNAATSILVTDNATGGVLITWTDPTDSTRTIEILKGVDSQPVNGVTYAKVQVGVQSYTDSSVTLGQTVRYVLRSVAPKSTSTVSDEVDFVVGSTLTTSTTTVDAVPQSSETTSTADTSIAVDTTTTEVSSSDSATTDTPAVSDPVVEVTPMVVFPDTEDHWAQAAISALVTSEIIHGEADGNFHPDESLNRAEASALLYRLLFVTEPTIPTEVPYSDVSPDAWYAAYVTALYDAGILDARLTVYQPESYLSQQEFLDLALKVQSSKGETDTSVLEGTVCPATICERANLPITRAEAADLLYALMFKKSPSL